MMLIQGDPLRRRGLSPHRLEQIAGDMRVMAASVPDHQGTRPPDRRCARVLPRAGVKLLFTRDSHMHRSGWLKNPQFERCLHLSISFVDPQSGAPAPFDWYVGDRLALAFFGDDRRCAWIESPKTTAGEWLGVWHWRVFCDDGWVPFLPSGEVYSRELTAKGWQSWSDRHGNAPEPSVLHAG